MNEFLRELATLGLGAGALTLLFGGAYRLQLHLRQRLSRKRDERKRQVLLALLLLACGGVAVALAPVIDAPRRPLFDYVGILLALTAVAALAALALDLLAGLQLRLRGAVTPGTWIHAGDYAGQVSRRGMLQVVLFTADGERVHLPNRYLAQVPVRLLADESAALQVPRLAHAPSVAAGVAVPGIAAEPSQVATRAGISERREPVLTPGDELPVAAGSADASPATARPAPPEIAVVPALDPATAEELRRLKNEYTELSQQLLDVERALQAAGQGEERQPLSLEKKKMEARLVRLDKQIVQLETGERRRA